MTSAEIWYSVSRVTKLALDLSVIYNQTFAPDLWKQLARELHFKSLKEKIVLPETLDALGQISAAQI